jgi:hypothetical protein
MNAPNKTIIKSKSKWSMYRIDILPREEQFS